MISTHAFFKRLLPSARWLMPLGITVLTLLALTIFAASIQAAAGDSADAPLISHSPTLLIPEKQATQAISAACGDNPNDIGGTVFRDYDADGVQDALEPTEAPAGMVVRAYGDNNSAPVMTATVHVTGTYHFPALADGSTVYRLEFSGLPDYLMASAIGSDNGGSVQFVTNGTCSADLALLNSADYCEANPMLAQTCFVNGDQAALSDTLVAYAYTSTTPLWGPPAVGATHLAYAPETGSVWALAWQRSSQTLFSSAFMKRHVGFGPLGPGGIYVTDMSGPTPVITNWVDISATLGIDVGADTRDATAANMLNAIASPAFDVAAYTEVGKRSIGDIDFDDDDRTLWLVNLNDRRLYGIENVKPNVMPSAADLILDGSSTPGVAIQTSPAITCANGELRPFAVTAHDDAVFVGAVCSGEYVGATIADVTAHVLRLYPDNIAAGFTQVFSFSLNYAREGIFSSGDVPWDTWYSADSDPTIVRDEQVWAQPMLTNIEFDVDGSMVLGFSDRWGSQVGPANYWPDPTASDTTNMTANDMIAFGDILRVCNTTSGYVLDGDTGCANNARPGGETVSANQGPNGGEYYSGEWGPESPNSFGDVARGGLALLLGSGEVTMSAFDPSHYHSGGTIWLDNNNGSRLRGYNIYEVQMPGTGLFGKADGVGEVELLCQAAPIEVGDRVWLDADGDGIQDPSENGIGGLNVTLDCNGTVVTATTATVDDGSTPWNEIGTYLFSSASNAPALEAGANCQLAIDMSQAGVSTTSVTLPNVEGDASNDASADVRDSDAGSTPTHAVIDFVAGVGGDNNHSLDFGFASFPSCGDNVTDVGGTVFRDYNADGTQASLEPGFGVGGMRVIAYGTSNSAVMTASIGTDGRYVLPSLADGNSYRLEFSGLPSYLEWGAVGSGSDTSVRFVSAASCTVDLGVNSPDHYCQSDPDVSTSCYVFGNQITGSYRLSDTLVTFPYSAEDDPDAGVDAPGHTATAQQIGTTWGLAYRRSNDTLYAAAFMKRHTGYGPGGPDAIYAVDPSGTTTPTVLINLGTTATGTDPHPTSNTFIDWFHDSNSWDAVGKQGLGDLDISADDSTLFVIGLADRTLYEIDIDSATVTDSDPFPLDQADCPREDIGDPALTADPTSYIRPFAVAWEDGLVYVGAVCGYERETAHDPDYSPVYVYSFDPATDSWQQVLHGNLHREAPDALWSYWHTSWWDVGDSNNSTYAASPLLTDIEFDRGDMILGIRDRGGDLYGHDAGNTDTGDAGLYSYRSAGDILRACSNGNGTWTLEENASCGGVTTAGAGNGEGLDDPADSDTDGEYYYQDCYLGAGCADPKQETSLGGLLQLPGQPDVMSTVWDPNSVYAQGTMWLSNTAGSQTRVYDLIQGTNNTSVFGKANGIGDLEALCSAAPLEVGNYIWEDTDGDGIQDPDETGLNGVMIDLYCGGTQVGSATTDANGHYLFGGVGNTNMLPYAPFSNTTTANLSVAASSDDAIQFLGGSGMILTWDQLHFGSNDFELTTAGLRFTSVPIPSGATINSAYIQCTANSVDSSSVDLLIEGELNLTPATFTTGSNDISSRTPTVNNVSWSPPNWTNGARGTDQQTPDLTLIVQELIDQGGWTAGGDMVFMVSNDGSPASRYRRCASQDHTTHAPPELIINYTYTESSLIQPLASGASCELRVNRGQSALSSYMLTAVNGDGITTNGRFDDVRDSDGAVAGANAVVSFTTGSAGQNNHSFDMGWIPSTDVQLGNRLWLESDGDGNAATNFVQAVTNTLVVATDGTTTYSATTDAGGLYTLTVPANATYTVTVSYPANIVPSGALISSDSDPGNNNDRSHDPAGTTVVMTTTNNLTIDFGFTSPGSIGDYLWYDADGDGVQDVNEHGIANVLIGLYDSTCTTLLDSQYTNANGGYLFGRLSPGDYCVQVIDDLNILTGMSATSGPQVHSGGVITLTAGETNTDVDFGYHFNVASNAVLGDRVWYDANGDGTLDPNEVGIAGVVITATNGITTYTATTDALGYYYLTVPAGTYTVYVDASTLPAGLTQTYDYDESLDNIATGIVVNSGDQFLGADFGYTDADLGRIGTLVWFDVNNSGVYDSGTEAGAVGVTVDLIADADGSGGWTVGDRIIGSVTTDLNGDYLFDGLPAGDYLVYVSDVNRLLLGYALANPGAPGVDNNNQMQPYAITLSGGSMENLTADFGYVAFTTFGGSTGAIGNQVWIDADTDGLYEPDSEEGIPGVVVELQQGGSTVMTTTTNSEGRYLFENLPAGAYTVIVRDTQSVLTDLSLSIYGAMPGADHNHQAQPYAITLGTGEVNLTADFGYINPREVTAVNLNQFVAGTSFGRVATLVFGLLLLLSLALWQRRRS